MTIYDGTLTAWLDSEIDRILGPIVPTVDKLYEGANSFEIKRRSNAYVEAREQLRNLAREYSLREHSGDYEEPIENNRPVYHGFEDDCV